MRSKKKDALELQRQNQDLRQQIEFKNRQIEDLQFSLAGLQKQQSIWEHLQINKTQEKDQSSVENALKQEINKLKSQIQTLKSEKQNQQSLIAQLEDKITDLKYTNQQLKKLNEKSHTIYQRQINILKSLQPDQEELEALKKEKIKLEEKIEKCDIIVKEMEEFYITEIDSLQKKNSTLTKEINEIKSEKQQYFQIKVQKENEVKEIKQKYEKAIRNVQKNQYKMKENVIEEMIKQQNHEKKWELMMEQMKERYQREIAELKDKIKFLIVKLQSIQDSKYFNENHTVPHFPSQPYGHLVQSKMVSSGTTETFKFTPSNSFSSSIKQSLSKRDNIKTPHKYRNTKSLGIHLDHTNV